MFRVYDTNALWRHDEILRIRHLEAEIVDMQKEIIESLPKLKYLPEEKARTVYEEMASKAPYLLRHRFITTGDVFPEGPVMPPEHTEPGEKLKGRMTKIEDKG